MPSYEYDCDACGDHFEIRASMTARPGELACPGCGSTDTYRDYGGIAVVRGARSGEPRPGELRPADPRRLTRDVAKRYANSTRDGVMNEVVQRIDRGVEPDQLHDFVREARAEHQAKAEHRAAPGHASESRARGASR